MAAVAAIILSLLVSKPSCVRWLRQRRALSNKAVSLLRLKWAAAAFSGGGFPHPQAG